MGLGILEFGIVDYGLGSVYGVMKWFPKRGISVFNDGGLRSCAIRIDAGWWNPECGIDFWNNQIRKFASL